MRIIYLVGAFPKLSETFILHQITRLIDKGHEVEIVAFHNPHEERVQEDVQKYRLLDKSHYIRYTDEKSLLDTRNVKELVPCLNADIVHVHFAAKPADVALDILKKIGIPYILTAHAYDIFIRPDVEGLRAKFRAAEKVITVSEYNRKYLLDLLGIEFMEKIEVQYLGIDLNRFQWVERKPKERTTLLFIGRLIEKKGVLDAIEAFRLVLQKHPAVELRIIGEGPQRESALQQAETLKISDRVNFLGGLTQESVLEEMKRADIFFLPSATGPDGDREGLPVVVLEAQAVGLPVISTRHTGIPEAVKEGETGFLLVEHDTEGMAQRIGQLIENPDLRIQMGLAGKKVVKTSHDIGREIDRLERTLIEVVQSDGRRGIGQRRGGPEYEIRVGRYYADVMESLEQQLRRQEKQVRQHEQKIQLQEQKIQLQEQQIQLQEQQIQQLLPMVYEHEGFIKRIQMTPLYKLYRVLIRKRKKIDLVYCPDWTKYNPYQTLLYEQLSRLGLKVEKLPAAQLSWSWLLRNRKHCRMIHLHWLAGIYDPKGKGASYKKVVVLYLKLRAARSMGYRIFWTVHNLNSHESSHKTLEIWIRKKVSSLAEGIIVHCHYAKKILAEEWDVREEKIQVIPHGTYAGYYPNEISREDARKRLGIGNESFVFLYFGMIRNYKGIKPLIRSFEELKALYPYARLVIAGSPFNDGMKREIETMAQDKGIHLFLEFISDHDVQYFFNGADMVVLPYENILTSGTAVLSLTFGKGIIAPRKGCMPELVTPEIGYLYDGEETTLTGAMLKAIQECDLENIRRHALQKAEEMTWTRLAKDHYFPLLVSR